MTGDTEARLLLVVMGLTAAAVYFLPAFIAKWRSHPNRWPIMLLNLLLGWTAIGWIAALIWSATAISKQARTQA